MHIQLAKPFRPVTIAIFITFGPWKWIRSHEDRIITQRQQHITSTENLFVLWEKSYILKIACMIGLPRLYGAVIVSYITSDYVLGGIIQPAWDGTVEIITGTGVCFISPYK